MKILKNKKGMTWEEIAKWAIIIALALALILAIITPARKFLLDKIKDLFTMLRFGI
jgi:hypothetical protein